MKLYEGRLPGETDPLMDELNRSLPVDIRLWHCDLATNQAWAEELARLGIYTDAELKAVSAALSELAEEDPGDWDSLPGDEDVHTLVERLLTQKLGDTGARIHTGRSRNDQVVCDLRLYAVGRIKTLLTALHKAISALSGQAKAHRDTLMAGTTHLQPALPVTLGHFLLSAAFALLRDGQRLEDAKARTNWCPLGSGAMAGSGFEVDREALAAKLGFQGVLPNSIDAVSDRDFCVEIASACASLAVHLSRYAEQFIFWANPSFGYIKFDDAWSTGSSMMPQKRNPDAMELVRGKAARVIAAPQQLMTMLKGLPLTYAKDLQEDKQVLFDALDSAQLVVEVFAAAVASARFQPEKLQAGLSADMLATDLADALARVGVPFRQAHERVARLVGVLEMDGRGLDSLSIAEMRQNFPEFGEETPRLSFKESVARRNVMGGTAPSRITAQLEWLEAFLTRTAGGNGAWRDQEYQK